MTRLVAYHPSSTDVALFETNGHFWIGSHHPGMTHQKGEPPYVMIAGEWTDEENGRLFLKTLRGDEI